MSRYQNQKPNDKTNGEATKAPIATPYFQEIGFIAQETAPDEEVELDDELDDELDEPDELDEALVAA